MRAKLPLLFFLFTVLVFVGSLLCSVPLLPERMATHFGASGRANGWMTRDQHLLFITGLAFFETATIVGICHAVRLLPSDLLNVPNAAHWRKPENFSRACRIIGRWSFLCAGLSLLWTAALNGLLVEANRQTPPHLAATPLLLLTLAYIPGIGIMILVLFLSFRKANT